MAKRMTGTDARATQDLTAEDRQAMLEGPPELATRMIRLVFGGLETSNPLLRPQIDRTKRRLLALSRLELRALRGASWEEERDRSFDDLRVKLEGYFEDPTLLIGKLDGHLTWLENASVHDIAQEAHRLPEAIVRLERVADMAWHRAHEHVLAHAACGHDGVQARPVSDPAADPAQIRRLMMAAFFDTIACREPELADRTERVKKRLLALSSVRLRALKGAMWQAKRDQPLSTLLTKLESWFEHPAERLGHLEQRLDGVEGLTSQAVEDQAALLPRGFTEFEERLGKKQPVA